MNRTHLSNKHSARTHRAISNALEGLEARQMLANTPVTVGNFTIGTAIWLNIVGTSGDDTIVVQKTAATAFRITNGTWALNKTGTYAGVRVLAGAGADSVATAGSLSFRLFAYGEAGNDTLTGGALADSLFGGADDDSLVGGIGNDTLRGESGNDTHVGGAGNDNALGGLGDDLLNGGDGADSLGGDAGLDTVNGDAGNDTLLGGSEADVISGGADADNISGEAGNDTLTGDAGNDVLNGGLDDDNANGGEGNDRVLGDAGTDVNIGGNGTDSLDYTGRTVALTLSLNGEADDGATGELDNIPNDFESLLGGNLDDVISGNSANNILNGGAGNDTVEGLGGNDRIYGGVGADSLSGGEGNDSIWGQADNDQMYGDDGADLLEGGAGNDQYFGGAGRDRLIALGGGVADSLTGGDDMDSYWLDSDLTEVVLDVSAEETAAAATHRVSAFVKYGTTVISKEINAPKLAEPTRHASLTSTDSKLVNYASYKLFADAGPSMDDIHQGQAGDCWWLAAIAGVADTSPETIRQAITDLGDGTYAVRFFNIMTRAAQYVRVDADLFTYSQTSNVPTYATLGAENSTWVALMEKAFTWVRYGKTPGLYASIDGGYMKDAYSSLGMTNQISGWGTGLGSASNAINLIRDKLDAGYTVSVAFGTANAYNLVNNHAYTVDHVVDNGNGTYSLVLRNPWGVDNNTSTDGANDGYVTLTMNQFFSKYTMMAAA